MAVARAAAHGQATVRIVCYNILSEALCNPAKYPTAPVAAALSMEARLAVVMARLEAEMARDRRAVICLQEVSVRMASVLHPFFLRRGYTLVCVHNDGPDHGWMGCALGIPLDAYDVLDTDIEVIARIATPGYDLRARAGKPDAGDAPSAHPVCEYRLAESFQHHYIGARLRLKGVPNGSNDGSSGADNAAFWCYVVHMPCMYKCDRDVRAQVRAQWRGRAKQSLHQEVSCRRFSNQCPSFQSFLYLSKPFLSTKPTFW